MKNFNFTIIIFTTFCFLFPSFSLASIVKGTIDPVYKYAWGEKIGWVNFGCKKCNVQITDSQITGYAWSENFGWINLSPTKAGVKNTKEGNLSGYAWGENLGWIDFSGAWIDETGRFRGYASSSIAGRINFECDYCIVKTDWRPSAQRPACSNGIDDDGDGKIDYPEDPGCSSIYDDDERDVPSLLPARGGALIIKVPTYEFKVLINNGAEFTTTSKVTLNLFGGPEAVKMSISNDPQFKDEFSVKQIPYTSSYQWDLCLGRESCPEGKYTVYVKFFDSQGKVLALVSDSIIYRKIPFKETSSLLEKLQKVLISLLPPFLRPKPPLPEKPPLPPYEFPPEKIPLVFQGEWFLLPFKPIKEFVLAPLPKEITALAQKFPKIKKIFRSLKITKISDVPKLRSLRLALPTLTEAVTFERPEFKPKKFLPTAIPLTHLTPELKEKIPSEAIFVKTGKGRIDLRVKAILGREGKIYHKFRSLSGVPLELIIKPSREAKEIKGYLALVSFKAKVGRYKASQGLSFLPVAFAKEKEEDFSSKKKLILSEFEYQDPDGDGIWTAKIYTPPLEGEYEIATLIEYKEPQLGKKEIRVMAVVDPEGYVYEKYKDKEIRIPGAIVFLYWLNPETKTYQLWPAQEYGQENPYITDVTGRYSFLVPPGTYYLKVEAPGYLSYQSRPFQVKESQGVYLNIELKSKYWFLKKINWTTILMIIFGLLLLYNFYRDRIREKRLRSQS